MFEQVVADRERLLGPEHPQREKRLDLLTRPP